MLSLKDKNNIFQSISLDEYNILDIDLNIDEIKDKIEDEKDED